MAEERIHAFGQCWWHECRNDADYIETVELKRQVGGRILPLYDGDVELCAGHRELARRTGRMNLDWKAVEQGLALQGAQV